MSSPPCKEGGKEEREGREWEGQGEEGTGGKAVGKGEFPSRVGSNKHKCPSLLHSRDLGER